MRHRAVQGDSEAPPCFDRRSAVESRKVSRTCRVKGGIRFVSPTHPKVHQMSAVGGEHAACRLAGDQGLKVNYVEQAALDQLRLGNRSGHAQNGFIRKKWRALGHGVHTARET